MATNFKCKFCKECRGYGCVGQLPGMGGVNASHNFILNCKEWQQIREEFPKGIFSEESLVSVRQDFISQGMSEDETDIFLDAVRISRNVDCDSIGIAPVTGAVQNIGFEKEEDFYLPYFTAARNQGIAICVGDGAPDEKLELGLKAVQALDTKAYFFLKPYPDQVLRRRIDLVRSSALAIGFDIDAYNIVTMRNQVSLEKKTAEQLRALREYSGLPLMIKGVFSREDIELCQKLGPEIAVVSNHGGRVETAEGSTAAFLAEHADELRACVKKIWVDGGIRSVDDVMTARLLGAEKVLIGRPFLSALCKAGISGMEKEIERILDNESSKSQN